MIRFYNLIDSGQIESSVTCAENAEEHSMFSLVCTSHESIASEDLKYENVVSGSRDLFCEMYVHWCMRIPYLVESIFTP